MRSSPRSLRSRRTTCLTVAAQSNVPPMFSLSGSRISSSVGSQRHALDLVRGPVRVLAEGHLECRSMWRPPYGSRSAGRRRLDQSRSTERRPRAKSCTATAAASREAEMSARGRANRRAELDRVGRKASRPGVRASMHEDVRHAVLSRRSATATAATGRSWRSLRALRSSLALERPGREPERLLSLAAEGPKANVQVALGLVVTAPLRARENVAPLLCLRDVGRLSRPRLARTPR